MTREPKGAQAARWRKRKFDLARRFAIPDDLLAGSLTRSLTRCGKPSCRCAEGEGHAAWTLTFMSGGQRRTVGAGQTATTEAPSVRRPTPRRLLDYVTKVLRLGRFLQYPGDGRLPPEIPARTLLWAILLGRLLRQTSFHAIEQLVRLSGCRALGVNRGFGDDALGYFTERLEPATTRAALVGTVRRAKRNKAFENSRCIGLAIDGTTAGRCRHEGCSLCRLLWLGLSSASALDTS